ncbi:hypothetical protein NEF87_004784 [Candidatus Lokiarchaeum ossiferum]|uniref:Uncharacterized protein n=1 Tax=Candidatus Lokiarchaeum ossiferum TaxID=2951803 RepID=A0ABY6I100_9ARCH|nr:hypothetical protein NEF87_004784 [Candidatus Lokiarchaeum sp. B-35]
MRIFKQLGFAFIVIALVLLFRKYPTLGVILAIIWFSRKFMKRSNHSSKAKVRELHQINQNVEKLSIVIAQLIENYQFYSPKSDNPSYLEDQGLTKVSQNEEAISSKPYY